MTALRAPTGGSSDGGDDDASAETVSDHGDSLREIALLIDALRDDDVAARQRSHAALPKIAAALGPRRCRDELVPFVCDLTDDVDGVLLELATRLAELGPLVGGARHAHVLLEPLAQLCAAEDAGVRAAAAETARGVCAALPEGAVAEHFAPFVEGLARHEWFTARSAACRAGRVAAARGRRAARHRSGARGRRRAGGALGSRARTRRPRAGLPGPRGRRLVGRRQRGRRRSPPQARGRRPGRRAPRLRGRAREGRREPASAWKLIDEPFSR